MGTEPSPDDPYWNIPLDADGNPVFVPLPEGYQHTYDRAMARCERAWRATGDPLILDEALTWTYAYRQPLQRWQHEAFGQLLPERRTPEQAKRALDRAKHSMRYQAVRDAHYIVGLSWENSRDRASEVLVGTIAAGEPPTMKASYELVKKDLKNGRGGKYHAMKLRQDKFWKSMLDDARRKIVTLLNDRSKSKSLGPSLVRKVSAARSQHTGRSKVRIRKALRAFHKAIENIFNTCEHLSEVPVPPELSTDQKAEALRRMQETVSTLRKLSARITVGSGEGPFEQ